MKFKSLSSPTTTRWSMWLLVVFLLAILSNNAQASSERPNITDNSKCDCSGNGECIDTGSFTCKCKEGFNGDRCQLTKCRPGQDDGADQCSVFGECWVDLTTNLWTCRCQPTHKGALRTTHMRKLLLQSRRLQRVQRDHKQHSLRKWQGDRSCCSIAP